ncbi:PP2C family protein-serine/threonine phosphatase [Streptomyces sp. TP-A0874]|uniref:PP2C family protein-serine/threonine phosphatase n=1 Tax=Streptomyces sp. TP-A0874 TaxID=549819 RepID=UPI000853B9EF|nr:SpoIIE family protein phosphatase [Streptomyces sp. TP-A0874]
MPSHVPADPFAAAPPERPAVDSILDRARQLRGEVDAMRREAVGRDGARSRWQRTLCDLAVAHLDDLGRQLSQLREGLPAGATGPDPVLPPGAVDSPAAAPPSHSVLPPTPEGAARADSLLNRVGSAEWNLLTDQVDWSAELFTIFGRSPDDGPLSLDELPSLLLPEDQGLLTAMVTGCLVDGRTIDGEFRVVRADGPVRTLHMVGEPVLDQEGDTASMWAVFRDVSELRRSQLAAGETRDSLHRQLAAERQARRTAIELQETVLPPRHGAPWLLRSGSETLELAAQYLPSTTSDLVGGGWYDALPLPDGATLLSVGELLGHGARATTGVATLLGALRGMAVAGIAPGPLLGWLGQMLDSCAQPVLGGVVCCRYDPRTRELSWAQAGGPPPLLFRDGTAEPLHPSGTAARAAAPAGGHRQHSAVLDPGDLLLLHTESLTPWRPGSSGERVESPPVRLLGLAPRLTATRNPREWVRLVTEEFSDAERAADASVLIARVGC